MNLELKILFYWAMVTAFLYVIARIKHWYEDSNMYFKYWAEDDIIGCGYFISFTIGVVAIILYFFVWFSIWWFN